MPCEHDYENNPRYYLTDCVEEGLIDPNMLINALLNYLDHSHCRELIMEHDLQPQFECSECEHMFDIDDLNHSDDDDQVYCDDCRIIVEARSRDDDDSCPETDCDETLNDKGDCPKCSLEEGY